MLFVLNILQGVLSYLAKTLGCYDFHCGVLHSIRNLVYVHAALIKDYLLVAVGYHLISDGEYRSLIGDLSHDLAGTLPCSFAYIESPGNLSRAIG